MLRHTTDNFMRTLRTISVLFALILGQVGIQAQFFSWDDGAANSFGGTSSGDLLALNHFNTGGSPVVIDEIRVLWNPTSSTVEPTVALYSDPDGDGDPSDIQPLLIYPISIPPNLVILNDKTFQEYSIPVTQVSGSFFVGAYLSDKESSFNPVIGVDFAHLGPNQSWIVENSSAGLLDLMDPIGTSTLTTPLDTFVAANHMIQAHFIPVPEPHSCLIIAFGMLCFAKRMAASLQGAWSEDR